MRSINALLSSLTIKLSNLNDSNNFRKMGVTFTISLILLSMVSASDLAGAQLISSQDHSNVLIDTSKIHDKTINPKTECNEPIGIREVSSRQHR